MRGCSRPKIQSYLDEFMWRHNNNLDRHEVYDYIFNELVRVYQRFSFGKIDDVIEALNGPEVDYVGSGDDELLEQTHSEDDDGDDSMVGSIHLYSFTPNVPTEVSGTQVVGAENESAKVAADNEQEVDEFGLDIRELVDDEDVDGDFEDAAVLPNADTVLSDEEVPSHAKNKETISSINLSFTNKLELVTKFRALIEFQNMSEQKLIFGGINSLNRAILHDESQQLSLYHWTEKCDGDSYFCCSRRHKDKHKHEISLKNYNKKLKSNETRIKEIDNMLTELRINSPRRIPLLVERQAIQTVPVSAKTKSYITEILNAKNDQEPQTHQRRAGRPKKGEEKPKPPAETKTYNLRKRS